ncbi:MAG: GNAT family N-acetyltransferase [Acidobacteria bacterium]|nr:GNAT family N-acetyltransferase [Acidobacteriota bacterium]
MVEYRLAERADIPAIAALREPEEGDGAPEGRMRGYLAGVYYPAHALQPRVMWVAVKAGAIVGYAAGHLTRRLNCDGELQWIYVAKPERGAGVGRALLDRVAEWFRRQEAYRVCVDPGEDAARAFYRHFGAIALTKHWLVWEDIRTIG